MKILNGTHLYLEQVRDGLNFSGGDNFLYTSKREIMAFLFC